MADIFISYKAEDRERVRPLVSALQAEGHEIWWDVHLGGGNEWREEIQQNLEAAKCAVVVWSKNSVGPEGRFVRDEASWALRKGTYVPVRIDNVQLPLGFGEVQAFPLVGWKGKIDDPHFEAAAQAIRARVEGGPVKFATARAGDIPTTRRAVLVGGSALAIAGLAGAGYWVIGGRSAENVRVAIMPFANLSSDPNQAYFADGLAEELRSALGRAGIAVIGRNSSDATAEDDVATIVRKLNVSHVLTGSVRRSSQMVRITSQLVDGSDGVEKWAGNYDRPVGESIAIQTDISEKIAAALSVSLGAALKKAIELGGTRDPVAQDLFMQAYELSLRHGNSEENFRKEIVLLDQAIARDKNYAIALVERGRRDSNLAVSYAKTAQMKDELLASADKFIFAGLKAAPQLGLGYAALAEITTSRLDLKLALQQGQKALRLAPKSARIIGMLMNSMLYIAPLSEVESLVSLMGALDPLNPEGNMQISAGNLILGKGEEAIAAGKRAAELLPENPYRNYQLAVTTLSLGLNDDAAKLLTDTPPGDIYFDALKAILLARRGDTAGATSILGKMRSEAGEMGSYQYAQVQAALGRPDGAFADLALAYRIKDPGLSLMKRDAFLKPLHSDPRFVALLNKLGFPDG